MQKDIHFYLTYALAKKLGINDENAEKIAWADQYTDELGEAELYGIQTQSPIIGNWSDAQIQMSVLIPFHFVPGEDKKHPWMTTENSKRANSLLNAVSDNLFQFGIALHALQDTFTHQGFSGWKEKLNDCFPWYYMKSALPNIGHAEMQVVPDVVNYIWTDPRNGQKIDNKQRALRAAKATLNALAKLGTQKNVKMIWSSVKPKLKRYFKIESYDKRIDKICALSGNKTIDFNKVNKKIEKKYKKDFIKAASNHLSEALKLFEGFPR